MRIFVKANVMPDFPLIAKSGTVLRVGAEYEAVSNRNGAICGICDNGEKLGLRPNEFKFLSMPQWIYDIWAPNYPDMVKDAVIEPDEGE